MRERLSAFRGVSWELDMAFAAAYWVVATNDTFNPPTATMGMESQLC